MNMSWTGTAIGSSTCTYTNKSSHLSSSSYQRLQLEAISQYQIQPRNVIEESKLREHARKSFKAASQMRLGLGLGQPSMVVNERGGVNDSDYKEPNLHGALCSKIVVVGNDWLPYQVSEHTCAQL